MTLPVFVGPVAGVVAGQQVVLEGEEARHASVVRRLRVGERVVVVDGEGRSASGPVLSVDRHAVTVEVDEVGSEPVSVPHVTVVQAIPKGDRGELAVEVLTEVGADRIVPWAASRCVAVWRGDRAAKSLARWRATAREAGKQSRRSRFPEVAEQVGTAEAAALCAGADLVLVLHEDAEATLAGVVASLDLGAVASVVVVVGPEGGISADELEALTSVGAVAVRLGPSVLRTSTAGLAAVAALLSRTPRWS